MQMTDATFTFAVPDTVADPAARCGSGSGGYRCDAPSTRLYFEGHDPGHPYGPEGHSPIIGPPAPHRQFFDIRARHPHI